MIDPRVSGFEARYQVRLLGPLGPGGGQDGFVLYSTRRTAVKFFDREERFARELEVYTILNRRGISAIAGHAVPEFLLSDTELLALEISFVERPFLLDFAGARLPHEVPNFEPHTMDEYYETLREVFGDRWSDALHVAAMFQTVTGFVLMDLHPGNVAFNDPPTDPSPVD